jgi:hypothetical protein
MVLYTDDPAYQELRVPVRVLKRAAGGVTATPSDVAVRFAAGQPEVSALVQLRTSDGKLVRVQSAESDHAGVTLKWSPGPATVAAIRVSVGGTAPTQAGTTRVKVTFAEPAGQELIIPVSWTAAPRR